MLAVIQTDDHWISGTDSVGEESWINPTRSDPAELVSQDDFDYAKYVTNHVAVRRRRIK